MHKEDIIQKGDVVLYYQNNFPVNFLHVVDIEADKPGWWKVTFLQIGMPAIQFSWLLDDNHIAQEIWTMNGIPNRIQLYGRVIPDKEVKRSEKEEIKKDIVKDPSVKGLFNSYRSQFDCDLD